MKDEGRRAKDEGRKVKIVTTTPVIRFGGLALVAAVGLVIGCGEAGPDRYDVSGKVTFQGQPVPAGQIVFEPDPTAGGRGPAGYAQIDDGQYSTRSSGKGPVAGPHIARITGLSAKPTDPNSESGPPPLFVDYEVKVELSADKPVHDFAVPAEAAQTPAPGAAKPGGA